MPVTQVRLNFAFARYDQRSRLVINGVPKAVAPTLALAPCDRTLVI
ncbi:hypothetical protein [Acinetobacter sp. P1(2025)]